MDKSPKESKSAHVGQLSNSLKIPIVAGLASGIALLALFSLFFIGDFTKFNERTASYQISIVSLPCGLAYGPCQVNFEPETIRVVVGVNNTVKWVNNDLFPAMLEANSNKGDPLFYTVTKDFVLVKPGDSFEFTFAKPSEYGYHGKPWQHGTVVVVIPAADR